MSQFEHDIITPRGVINVREASDPNYPGVYVGVNGTYLVLVEFDSSEDCHIIRVWNKEDPDNDYEYMQHLD